MAKLWGIAVSRISVMPAHQRLEPVVKKDLQLSRRDELKRQAFPRAIEEQICQPGVYVDKQAASTIVTSILTATARLGETLFSNLMRTERVDWIAALKQGALRRRLPSKVPVTGLVLNNGQLIELPQLQPGDVIVIDNASFHRFPNREIVAAAGCRWYLPPIRQT